MDINLEEIKDIFLAESSEILQKMESTLLFLESNPVTDEKINELFRAVHTIKGSAGIFGYSETVSFTHVAENLLDKVREKEIQLDQALISLLLDCRDHISDLIEYAANNRKINEEMQSSQEILLGKLNSYLKDFTSSSHEEITQISSWINSSPNLDTDKHWHISLRFKEGTFRSGLDPFSVIKYLNRDGVIENLITFTSLIPDLNSIDPENCYVGFEIEYKSDKDMSFILQAFEFVEQDCDILILPPNRTIEDIADFFKASKSNNIKLAKILLEMGTITKEEIKLINRLKRKPQKTSSVKIEKIRNQTEAEKPVQNPTPKEIEPEISNTPSAKEFSSRENKIIRIDSSKLDQLINLVGELVIGGANVNQLSQNRKDPELQESSYFLNNLIGEIRDMALKIRMVQIGETFSRFQRTVRDIGNELNKNIHLTISGAETELDKTVVEKISDPLMHLIRNAIDHGIESKEERIANGKSEVGELFLNAYHETGSIVIEVKDDGKGLDQEKILKKALDKGLVSSDKHLSENEVYRLIFSAGFSTAEKITNISGRGVGLDVVMKNVEALRGSVSIESEKNKGTTFKVRLPLTLAIIDGFLFKVGASFYVVPLDLVVECLEYTEDLITDQGNKNFINLRGEILPFLRLGEFFHTKTEKIGRRNILVLQYSGRHVGLLIDSLHGEIQTVIKPLGKIFQHLKGISGSTIMGSGEVGLIIDIPSLFKKVEELEQENSKQEIIVSRS